jgi:NAD(P)H-nitrite reductase large subunit
MSEHCVIIGNGPAGNEAALTLRNKVPNLRITMISKEPTRYYQPNLLPDYIAGKVGADDVYVNPLDFYSENDIKLRLGQPVTSLDLERRQLSLDHKEVIRFDSLIIAAGGRPRIPEPVQVFSELMMTLKTFEDADKWMHLLKTAESVLVVGGDLTSLVFTNALLELGKRVYFILNEDSFWPVRYNDEIHAQVSKKLFDRGVEVIACQNLRRISSL